MVRGILSSSIGRAAFTVAVEAAILLICFVAFPTPWAWLWVVPAICAIVLLIWSGTFTATQAGRESRSASAFIAGSAAFRSISWVAIAATLCALGDLALQARNPTIDIVGSIAVLLGMAYLGMGGAAVVENEKRIALQDVIVASVRTEHRTQSRVAFSYVSRISSLQPTLAASKISVDLLVRKTRTIELALAHSHGGGVGSLDRGPENAFTEFDILELRQEVEEMDRLIQRLEADPDSQECCKSAMDHAQRIERRLLAKGLI